MRVSRKSNFAFENDLSQSIDSYTLKRAGEVRIGEVLSNNWNNPSVNYVIVGISESIGPQANFGRSGAEKAFDAFLNSFCNLQFTNSTSKDSFAYFGKITSTTAFSGTIEARDQVSELDDFILELISPIIIAGKIPIVIGGGHNNAFPLIQTIAKQVDKLAVINMDAHSDCRALEGRHSGNSFSYAFEENFLTKYGVFGLHKAYLNQAMIDYFQDKPISFGYFDDYSLERKTYKSDVINFLNSLKPTEKLGVELDLDCVANFPSSAMSPIGFTLSDVRNYLALCSKHPHVAYYHLTEAAINKSGDERIVGKTLAQLVYDIITEFRY